MAGLDPAIQGLSPLTLNARPLDGRLGGRPWCVGDGESDCLHKQVDAAEGEAEQGGDGDGAERQPHAENAQPQDMGRLG
jgi:hypothetical protein